MIGHVGFDIELAAGRMTPRTRRRFVIEVLRRASDDSELVAEHHEAASAIGALIRDLERIEEGWSIDLARRRRALRSLELLGERIIRAATVAARGPNPTVEEVELIARDAALGSAHYIAERVWQFRRARELSEIHPSCTKI